MASEFAAYDFDTLASASYQKLQVLYAEALRQRAARYSLLGAIINKPNMKDRDQRGLDKTISNLLDPFGFKEEDTSGWDALRKRRDL